MSEIKVNIIDAGGAISGTLHGSFMDALIASLCAEPETIGEFETALKRFVKSDSDWAPLKHFYRHQNLEPYDAGILAIDLAGRVIGVESTYADTGMTGNVRIEADFGAFADEDGYVWVPYHLPDDWRIVRSIPLFEGTATVSRRARSANMPFDARPILFGKPLIEFLLTEMMAAVDLEAEDLFSDIHAKWLMSPRDDLRGKTPREVLFEKQKSISWDLESRARQYSSTKLCPKPIPADSFAYRNAGFGVHEMVMYYDLVRVLMSECYTELTKSRGIDRDAEIDRLSTVGETWLNSPDPESSNRLPADIIETERKRLNLTMSAQECLIDDDCPCCIAMYEDFDTPGFVHFDGSSMDYRFEFSFCKTREEWDEEQRRYDEYTREFNEKWKNREFETEGEMGSGEDPF